MQPISQIVPVVQPDSNFCLIGFVYLPIIPGNQPIPPGGGLLATMWFTLPAGTADQTIVVDSGFIPPAGDFLLVDADGSSVIPEFFSGTITIGTGGQETPILSVDPLSLTFNATEGGANPVSQSFSITNIGDGTLNWTASETGSWLDLSSTSGAGDASVTVSVDISGLTANTFNEDITITAVDADGSPQTVAVTLNLAEPPPTINLSETLFTFESTEGAKELLTDLLTVTNTGGGTLNWNGSVTGPWLSINPASGTAPSDVDVNVNTNGLTAGVYKDTIVVSAAGATNTPQRAIVELTINEPPPTINLSETLFTFEATEGQTDTKSATLTITNTGGGTLNWNGSVTGPWLSIDPASGTAPSDVDVVVDPTGLTAGLYKDTIEVSATGATNTPQLAVVEFTINEPDPEIAVDPASLAFSAVLGDTPADQTLEITNAGGGTLNFTLSNNETWLSADASSGAAPAEITYSIDVTGLGVGTYNDVITVAATGASNTPVQVPVELTILDLDPVLVLSTNVLNFELFEGADTDLKSFDITNGGGGTLNWSAGKLQSWSALSSDNGTAPSTVDVTVDANGLAVGLHYDTITVIGAGAADSPQEVEIVFNILENPQFVVTQEGTPLSQLVFEGEVAKSLDAQYFDIASSTVTEIDWTESHMYEWLTLSPDNGTTPTNVMASVNATGLEADTYYDTIVISQAEKDMADDVEIEVVLILNPPAPEFDITPASLTFSTTEGNNPADQMLNIASTGAEMEWYLSNNHSWLSVIPSTGTTPSDVTVSVDVISGSMTEGIYYDTIFINNLEKAAQVEIPVTLTIGGSPILVVDSLNYEFETPVNVNPANQQFTITNAGGGDLEWTAGESADWLALSQYSGTNDATVDIMVDVTGLIPGVFTTSINVSGNSQNETINVKLTITAPDPQGGDTVWVGYDTLTLGTGQAVVEINLKNDNEIAGIQIPLNYNTAIMHCDSASFVGSRVEGADILMAPVDSAEGTINLGIIPTETDLIPEGSGLLATLYFTPIAVGYSDIDTGFIIPASEYVFVDPYVQDFYPEFFMGGVKVDELIAPLIVADPTSFSFEATVGGANPLSQTLTVTNGGAGSLDWMVTNTSGWLSMAPTSGGDGDMTTLSVAIGGLAVGVYYDTIQVTAASAANSPLGVPVMLTINDVGPERDSVIVTTVNVNSSATDSVVFNVPVNIHATQIINGGSLGLYYDSDDITIDSISLVGGLAQNTTNSSIVAPESNLAHLGFLILPIFPNQEPVEPGDGLLANLWFTLDAGAPDQTINLDSGFVPPAGDFILVDAEGSSVIPGFRPGQIIVTSSVEPPVLTVDPMTLEFEGTVGEVNNVTQNVNITNTGGGTINWEATLDGDWLEVTPLSGTAPTILDVSVDMTGLPVDTYVGSIRIEDTGTGDTAMVEVTLTVNPVVEPGLNGTVVDVADGSPIADAVVEVFDAYPGTPLASGLTDEFGEFSFPALTAGDYILKAYKDGYYPNMIDVEVAKTVIEIELEATNDLVPTYEWVNFYCNDNYINGELIQPGDVIEAYNPEGFLCGQYFVTEEGSYGFMPVYRDDEFTDEKDGCEPGDLVSFTINGFAATTDGDPTWTSNGDNIYLCLDAQASVTRCIELAEGWNLISWNVDTESDDVEDLIADIKDDLEVILSFEVGALTYDPAPEMAPFNTLTAMDHFHGYWFYMNNPAEFCVTGAPVDAATPIALEAGWNLASYLPTYTMEIETALNSIMPYILVVLGYDGGGLSYDPDLKDYSTLDSLRMNFGYWIKVTEDAMLSYTGVPAPNAKLVPDIFTNGYDLGGVEPTTNWANLYSSHLTVNGEPVAAGAVLKAVDESGKPVGSFTVSENGQFGFMPVYGAESGSQTGLQNGDQFRISVDGQTSEESFTFFGGGTRIEVGSVTVKSAGSAALPTQYNLAQNYPNPFNPQTSISYDLPNDSKVELVIFNILGEKVATLVDEYQTAGSYNVTWYGTSDGGKTVASGVYFYRLNTGDYVKSMKMSLMK